MAANTLCHLGVAWLRCCYISPGRRQGGDQALGITALARPSAAEDERERYRVRHIGCQDIYVLGMSWPIRAVNPTPTIAAPTSRGVSSEMPKLRRRADRANPTVDAPGDKTRAPKNAFMGGASPAQ